MEGKEDRLDIEIIDPEENVGTDKATAADCARGLSVKQPSAGDKSADSSKTETAAGSSNKLPNEVGDSLDSEGVGSSGTTEETAKVIGANERKEKDEVQGLSTEGGAVSAVNQDSVGAIRHSEASTGTPKYDKEPTHFTTSNKLKLSNKLLYSLD